MRRTRRSRACFRKLGLGLALGFVSAGCAERDESPSKAMSRLYQDWQAGAVVEIVELDVLGATYCVDIVRDYREAKLGFARVVQPVSEVAIRVHNKYEVSDYSEDSLFIVIDKPFALRLETCEQKREPTLPDSDAPGAGGR